MSALLFLSSEDFGLQRASKGQALCHSIPGFSLILFYSTHCDHCQKLIPIFKKLPGTIGGCQFGMLNVSMNKEVVGMSRESTTPITYVPYIMFYIDGQPFTAYSGPYQESEIRKFIIEVANTLQKKQQFSKEKFKQVNNSQIPVYCIGKPVCGDDQVCYLDFGNAYNIKRN